MVPWEKMPLLLELISSVHVDNKGADILILGEGPTQGLDDTTLTAKAKYTIILHLHFTNSAFINLHPTEYSQDFH